MVGGRLSGEDLISSLEKVTEKTYSIDQREAILHRTGPLWITAGPGSGKSEVLVARTLKLLISDNIPPESIVLTTFTEKAAANLSERIESYLEDLGRAGEVDATEIRSGTLHSLCNSIMREHRFPDFIDLELMDENSRLFFLYNQKEIVDFFKENWGDYEEVFPGFGISKEYGPNQWSATGAAAFLFDRITEFRVDVDAMQKSQNKAAKRLAEVYGLYRDSLLENYRCDFATIQEYFLKFLDSPHGNEFLNGNVERQREPVRHLLVDEFQDTNPIQEDIYFRMSRTDPHNLAVVGDDDQALYRFRGGTVDSLVNFGDRCKREWKTSAHQINLHENRRSHPDIVEWFNRYVFDSPAMKKHGVRAPGKREMIPKSDISGDYQAVSAVFGATLDQASEVLAEFVGGMKRVGIISDWKQVAVLLRSTRESPRNAGPLVAALRDRGIRVYNPRNRGLHEDTRIQQLLGALIATLDSGFETLKSVRGRVVGEIKKWTAAYAQLAKSAEGRELAKYVDKSQGAIGKLGAGFVLNATVMDVLYRILSLSPFRELKEDPNYATRFAIITDLIDAFSAFTEKYGVLRTSASEAGRISFSFMRSFYYQFSGFIEAQGLNEPEDPEDLIPAGYVQIMTVHQAKGLEFPVVVVGSLNDNPRVSGDNWTEDFLAPWSPRKPIGKADERAEQDLIRRFYVAYSRAQNLLVLCGKRGSLSKWGLGDWRAK